MSSTWDEGSKLNHLGLVAPPPAATLTPWPGQRTYPRRALSAVSDARGEQTKPGAWPPNTEDAPAERQDLLPTVQRRFLDRARTYRASWSCARSRRAR